MLGAISRGTTAGVNALERSEGSSWSSPPCYSSDNSSSGTGGGKRSMSSGRTWDIRPRNGPERRSWVPGGGGGNRESMLLRMVVEEQANNTKRRQGARCIHQLARNVMMRGEEDEAPLPGAEEKLKLTPAAVAKMKQLRETRKGDVNLRLEVDGGGCSGFQYVFKMEENPPADGDYSLTVDGVTLMCDQVSMEFLEGSTIDYESDLMKSAFVVRNLALYTGYRVIKYSFYFFALF